MIKTNNFNTLPLKIKNLLESKTIDLNVLLNDNMFKKLETAENRSYIFEIDDSNLIIKYFNDKGKRDSDIEALLELDGIKYFPTIFAYEKNEYVIMERASGEGLDKLLIKPIDKKILFIIKEQVKEATELSLQRNRYDWDFKLEHLYWDKNLQELKVIDLGLFDPVGEDKQFKERLLNNRLKSLDEMLDDMMCRVE